MAKDDLPTIGRIVHYVLDRGRAVGRCRPALVVNVMDDASPIVNLVVLLDGPNDIGAKDVHPTPDDPAPVVMRVGSVHSDNAGRSPGSWHWPERK